MMVSWRALAWETYWNQLRSPLASTTRLSWVQILP